MVIGAYANSYWRVENPYVVHGEALMPARVARYVEVSADGELPATAFEPGWTRTLDLWLKGHLQVGAHALSLVHHLRHLPRMPALPHDEAGIRRAYQPALAELTRANRLVRAHGARLVVLVINGQQADGTFLPVEHVYNRILAEHCASEGILFVDPLPELERSAAGRAVYRFDQDLHWTPEAHAVAAATLGRRLDQERLLEPPGRRRLPVARSSP